MGLLTSSLATWLKVAWAKHKLAVTLGSVGLGGITIFSLTLFPINLPPNLSESGEVCGPAEPQIVGFGGNCAEAAIKSTFDGFSYRSCADYALKLERTKKKLTQTYRNQTPFEFKYWETSNEPSIVHYIYSYCPKGEDS